MNIIHSRCACRAWTGLSLIHFDAPAELGPASSFGAFTKNSSSGFQARNEAHTLGYVEHGERGGALADGAGACATTCSNYFKSLIALVISFGDDACDVLNGWIFHTEEADISWLPIESHLRMHNWRAVPHLLKNRPRVMCSLCNVVHGGKPAILGIRREEESRCDVPKVDRIRGELKVRSDLFHCIVEKLRVALRKRMERRRPWREQVVGPAKIAARSARLISAAQASEVERDQGIVGRRTLKVSLDEMLPMPGRRDAATDVSG